MFVHSTVKSAKNFNRHIWTANFARNFPKKTSQVDMRIGTGHFQLTTESVEHSIKVLGGARTLTVAL